MWVLFKPLRNNKYIKDVDELLSSRNKLINHIIY